MHSEIAHGMNFDWSNQGVKKKMGQELHRLGDRNSLLVLYYNPCSLCCWLANCIAQLFSQWTFCCKVILLSSVLFPPPDPEGVWDIVVVSWRALDWKENAITSPPPPLLLFGLPKVPFLAFMAWTQSEFWIQMRTCWIFDDSKLLSAPFQKQLSFHHFPILPLLSFSTLTDDVKSRNF